MELLRILALGAVGLGGCYSPELRDCAVFCSSDSECGPGQVCGGDGMCASPAVSGHCNQPPPHDAAPSDAAELDAPVTMQDAFVPPADAPSSPDASLPPPDAMPPTQVTLTIVIKDRGRVDVAGIGSCSDSAPQHMCTFTVPAGVSRLLHAVPGDDRVFDKWEMGVCTGSNPTCVFTPTAASSATAKFKHD